MALSFPTSPADVVLALADNPLYSFVCDNLACIMHGRTTICRHRSHYIGACKSTVFTRLQHYRKLMLKGDIHRCLVTINESVNDTSPIATLGLAERISAAECASARILTDDVIPTARSWIATVDAADSPAKVVAAIAPQSLWSGACEAETRRASCRRRAFVGQQCYIVDATVVFYINQNIAAIDALVEASDRAAYGRTSALWVDIKRALIVRPDTPAPVHILGAAESRRACLNAIDAADDVARALSKKRALRTYPDADDDAVSTDPETDTEDGDTLSDFDAGVRSAYSLYKRACRRLPSSL